MSIMTGTRSLLIMNAARIIRGIIHGTRLNVPSLAGCARALMRLWANIGRRKPIMTAVIAMQRPATRRRLLQPQRARPSKRRDARTLPYRACVRVCAVVRAQSRLRG